MHEHLRSRMAAGLGCALAALWTGTAAAREVTIRNVVSGASLMEGSLTLQVGETQENGSSYRSFPLVLDLSQMVLPEPGDYEIQATIDGGDARTIGFTAAAVASPES